MDDFGGGLRNVFGSNARTRARSLGFELPATSKKFKATSSAAGVFYRHFRDAQDSDLECLRLIHAEIRHLNRCPLGSARRLSLTREMTALFYPIAVRQIEKQAETTPLPESDSRRESLTAIAEISHILLISYQILFSDWSGGFRLFRALAARKLSECRSRIFEMMLIKQRAKGLRYQVLQGQDWRAANTLFELTRRSGGIEIPLPTLKNKFRGGERESILEMYIQLQISAWFDTTRWPTPLHWTIESYLGSLENAVNLLPDRTAGSAPGTCLFAYAQSGLPARAGRLSAPPGAEIVLDCGGLFSAIASDCRDFIKSRSHAVSDDNEWSSRMARFPESERIVIARRLTDAIAVSEPDLVSFAAIEVEDFRVFAGFAAVHSLLEHRQGGFKSEERLVDLLAKRSAVIADDHKATAQTLWTLLFKNDSRMRLCTRESTRTTRMAIGSLLAYGIGDDVNRPSLAVVTRISRPAGDDVVIDLHLISGYAEAVRFFLNPADIERSQSGRPGILAYDIVSGWILIVPPLDFLLQSDRFVLRRGQVSLPIGLTGLRDATDDLYVFNTSLDSAQLGFGGEPSYPGVPKNRGFDSLAGDRYSAALRHRA